MATLRVSNLRGRSNGESPTLPDGAVVTGVTTTTTLAVTGIATATTLKVGSAITAFGGIVTATTFKGDLTGDVTGDVTGNADTATNAQGLTGTPNITVGSVVGSALTISGISTLTDLRLASIADKTTIVNGNTVSLAYSSGGGNVAIALILQVRLR